MRSCLQDLFDGAHHVLHVAVGHIGEKGQGADAIRIPFGERKADGLEIGVIAVIFLGVDRAEMEAGAKYVGA